MTPTRNNRGVAHENGAIESAHGHLKSAIERCAAAARLARLRRSRRLSPLHRRDRRPPQCPQRQAHRRRARRPAGAAGPAHRDYEEAIVTVTSSGGFTLRKVFYTVPSRLIGHRLRVRLYDDRLEVFLGGTPSDDAAARARACQRQARPRRRLPPRHPRAAAQADGAAQPRLPRPALPARGLPATFEALLDSLPDAPACRIMVDLLALAHERGCEARTRRPCSTRICDAGRLPDLAELAGALRARSRRSCPRSSSRSPRSPPTRHCSAPAVRETRHEAPPTPSTPPA